MGGASEIRKHAGLKASIGVPWPLRGPPRPRRQGLRKRVGACPHHLLWRFRQRRSHLHRSFRVREVMMKTIRATLAIIRRWTRQVWRSRRRLRRGEATEEKQEEEAGSAARSRLSLRAFENCLIFFLVLLKYFIGSWWWVGRGKEVGRKKRLRTKNKPIRGGYFSILLFFAPVPIQISVVFISCFVRRKGNTRHERRRAKARSVTLYFFAHVALFL